MQAKSETTETWRAAEFVSMPQAAKIAGLSISTIRHFVHDGALQAVRCTRGAPMLIRTSSLIDFVESFEPIAPRPMRRKLTLVVDNAR